MGFRMNLLSAACLLALIHSSHGCTMEGVNVWQLPITVSIEDYHEGIILQRSITDIGGFTLSSYSELNGGPYVTAAIENSAFVLRTNDAYKLYEENETVDQLSLTYTFSCTNGASLPSPLTIIILINDNNNNPPLFKTSDTAASTATTYDFTIAPPVPPGFLITNCVSDIIVRDIDLTTYRIDFSIEDNPYIAIEYDEAGSTEAKEFKAVLKTTTFIRSIPEPIILTISATDVDQTGDPPITTNTTVTIHGSSEFEMPAEPVFSQAFYLASYFDNNQVSLEQPITLQQGYDDLVQFSLEGDYAADHFAITNAGNLVVLSATTPLPTDTLQGAQIYLVVNAIREYTSGASATIVVQLPEAVDLEFEQPHYQGQIVDNTLQLTQLILSQGYQGAVVNVTVEDYSSFFTASLAGNVITLSMTPLDENIIQENNVINLRVTASTGSSLATAIVTLEIVKDDVTTPQFDQTLYTGTYNSNTGLTINSILLVQGYDETVNVSLSGEYENYFELVREGPSSTLQVVGGSLPSHILGQSHLILAVQATKPRTVGASVAVSITLPGARELQFAAQTYKGSVQDNILTLDTITLSVGYEADVTFSLSGDYSTSFAVSNVQNQVTINLPAQLPQEIISENNFIMLTLHADGVNTLSTTTAVLIEIIKDDVTTPVFSQPIYYGTYLGSSIDIANINLIQGYDSSVSFRIEGENSEYFTINQNINNLTLVVASNIPDEVVLREKTFVFNIFADKPLTVSANTAIVIKFSEDLTEPTVMRFASNAYTGVLENNLLTLESIVLETGFAAGTQFLLTGDYARSFTHAVTDNIVTLSMTSELSAEVLENNNLIVLELEARRDGAVSAFTGIIVDLIKEEIEVPLFSQAYYSGIYTEENSLQWEETIALAQGFDETVTFGLEGESATWFAVEQSGNSATIVSTSAVPQNVLDSHHQLLFTVVAYKPNATNAHAAISIELPKDILEQEVLRFTQSSYEGQFDGTDLQVPTITLSNDITEDVLVNLTGAYASYFTVTRESNVIHIGIMNELPSEVLTNNEFIVLDIAASKPDAVSGYTTLILSIVKEPIIVTPVFEQPYYTGEISEQGTLLFEHTMRLIQGFDESVAFTLSGDGSERFILTQTGQNSLSLSVAEEGIDQIENISHFVFSVVASKAGSISGQAAVVIHNPAPSTTRTLRFSHNYYRGSVEEDLLMMESISIVEGYSPDVQLTLSGDYAEYFQLVGQDGTYTMQLVSNISSEVIGAHSVLVYTLEALADDARTYATIIVELVKDDSNEIEPLTFDEAYYVGSYSATSGVMENIQLHVVSGYDSDAVFTIEGGNGAWFNVQHAESIVTINLVAPLPAELFIENRPFVFALNGINSGGSTSHVTIVISLEGELSEITVLGFERNNYLGSIENGISTLEPIVLSQGYSDDVHFTLQGGLSNYFRINQQNSTINVVLENSIPVQDIPTNRVIVLDLLATAAQATSAATTIVFKIVAEQELSFDAAYYVGQYSEAEGLFFDSTISLDAGYDQNVQFGLEGEHSQWFSLQAQNNAVTLTASGAIPPAILANNHQLVFSVTAQKPNSNLAIATVVISLVDDNTNVTILGFERANYLGVIDSDVLILETIVVNEGYTDAVTFTLHGDLVYYFTLVQHEPGTILNIILDIPIPQQLLPTNGIVLLELRASAPQAVAATTTIVVETQRNLAVEEIAFSADYYIGQYSETEGLSINTTISLGIGYDDTVSFALEGDHAQWFSLQNQGNVITLTTSGAIPPAILVNNHQLVFSVTAQKLNSNIATATIVISLVDDFTDAILLGFERASYLGAIESDVLSLEPIVLTEGYTEAVTFTLHGDLAAYFNLQRQGSTINIALPSAIPEQLLPANGIVLLELRASAPQAVAATTTVVVETQRNLALEELVFTAAYYIGQYSETDGLSINTTISLGVGYDDTVSFALEGEHAQWFSLQTQGNSVILTTSGAIPPAILVNNHQLVFSVTAQKPNSNIATATIVISLIDDFTDATILGFERASYLGAIESDVLSLEPIVLSEGYTEAVTFTLHGELAAYFNLQQQGSTINIALLSAIPEQLLPANGIVLLELRASAPQAVAATTTIVVETQRNLALEELVFTAAYYIGQYSETNGLSINTTISLGVGYDDTVSFALEGEHAQWFGLQTQGNSVTLTTSGAIPPAILVNNHQLVFSVTAQKPNSNIATATIVISLVDDFTDAILLGFERASYLGAIESDVLSIEPIVLSEGYTEAVTFTLYGELAAYFNLQQQGSTINIALPSPIPEQLLPANGIVLLELRASAPQAVAATTTIVIETQRNLAVEEIAFSADYYIGQYSETEGLSINTTISLGIGYDDTVNFALEGEHAQWFSLQNQGNVITLTTSGAIPPAILVNNHQLVFSVTAQKPNSNIATATIVISLVDDFTDAILLGFERASYLGAIEINVLSLEPIVLTEGYTEAVTFTLHGDLAAYFNLQQQGSTINIALPSAIPEQLLPANGIVLLELRASAPQAVAATTTIVVETQRNLALEELVFTAAYYIGQYSETDGLSINTTISLGVGYDETVSFALEGEHAQWFSLQTQGNSVTLTTSGAIPPAILVNNHQLVFSVTAQKPNSNIATATIVISLVDDFTDAILLGFERASYLGAIESDVLSLEPIVLTEGYTEAVTFTLHGDLAAYFNLQQQGSTINIALPSPIPEQLLPANGIVLLELRASAPQAVAATTTIVIETQRNLAVEEIAFSADYYIGQYSETEGLSINTTISLGIGYDDTVNFALEGEHAQWFSLQNQGNVITLTTSGAIPPAILVNNHQLVFSVTAQKPNSNIATATIVISLVDDFTDAILLGFERASYLGAIEIDVLSLEPIVLTEGYTEAVTFTLHGDLAAYFNLQQQGSTINIALPSAIPEQLLPANGIVLLELRASAPQAVAATTTVVVETQRNLALEELVFTAAYYIGQYSETDGLSINTTISLGVGYDDTVSFALEGEHAQWFSIQTQGNVITLTTSGAIPPAILVNNHQLVFSITAQKPNSNIATATIVISLIDDLTDAILLGFERASYLGAIESDALSIEPIVLSEGYTEAVTFTLHGELAAYFNLQQQGSTINIALPSAIPEQLLPANGIVLLELRASAPQAVAATTTVVVETQRNLAVEELAFSAAYYIGQYSETEGLSINTTISLGVGYDENVNFALEGEHAQWFSLQNQDNTVVLTTSSAIPPAILVNNHQLVFSVTAQKPNSNIATATIVISIVDDFTDAILLGFERASYIGAIESDGLTLEPIVLTEGYTEAVTFTLHGELASYFNLQQQGSTVNIMLPSAIPEQELPANGIVLLELRASAQQAVPAIATIVVKDSRASTIEELAFSADYYIGQYSDTEGLSFETGISLDVGYDETVTFTFEGEFEQWFDLSVAGNSISLELLEPIPPTVLVDVRKIIFTVRAFKGDHSVSTIVVISVIDDSGSGITEAFDKVLYEGTINLNVVQHEPITITGYTDNVVEILGVYRELFSATVSGGTVVVGAAGTLTLPEGVTHVALELRAGGASAVIVFDVVQSETPVLPTVAFGSPSYVLRAEMGHTGLVGQLSASASNGESVGFSLVVTDAHLQERISINSAGEIHLSAPTNTGVYSFEAVATSTITQVQATATVQLTVEAAATCGDDHALHPLIVIDRDEEEPHTNLVVLDSESQAAGCQYSLTNRWPVDQNWLYVDQTGLHATPIDREDPRIAFMALSQVQVELVLECPSDPQNRSKRSTSPRLDWLGPYEYGTNKWILTDTILYNSRRSFVNLIVNDINDNYPIFVGKENEPIVCGYPIPELEELILPRALAELKATDADVGENAALVYWSSSEVLAVAPTTGSVHVRDGATLTQDQLLTVAVTDLNGSPDGLTGTIDLMVKLIDTSHIAVVTVRNAFLDQEETILSNLSSAVGYEVKVLSSAVISDEPADSANARRKRDVTAEGASLQLYVYGVIDREPIAVDQLKDDITESALAVDVTSTVSLEDYLEGREIQGGGGRDTGLLVATIVLSVLLFILIVAIALWFFLRWRKARNYDQFSDVSTIASRDEPLEAAPKLEIDNLKKPRLNIDELKRSERRLQEMLDAPVDGVVPKAQTSQTNPEDAFDTIINIAPTDSTMPIVIQSIDKLKDDANSGDEDEFGERKNKSRRKSVVTFNENVEKIIQFEDIPDDNSSTVEVFKL